MAEDFTWSMNISYAGCGVSSPIQSLSTEVLSLIFFAACEDDRLTRVDRQRRTCTALSIGVVCGHWRQIMLSRANSHCWASFVISDQHLSRLRDVIPILKLYLKRSGSEPLHLQVYLETRSEGYPILPLLMQHSHRWERITICIPSWMSKILKEPRDLPRLVDLDFGFIDTLFSYYGKVRSCFSEAENLRTLALRNIQDISLLIAGSNEITHYTSERACVVDALRYASVMDDLEELEILCPYDSESCLVKKHALVHTSLRVIHFTQLDAIAAPPRSTSRKALKDMFRALTVPALQHLHVDLESWHSEPRALQAWHNNAVVWPHTSFLAFIHRSGLRWSLTALHLSNVNFTAAELIQCLDALPGVMDLDMDEPPDFESAVLVKWLTRHEALGEPWAAEQSVRERCGRAPRLVSLGIGGRLEVGDEELVMLVESRMEHSEMAAKWGDEDGGRGEGEGEDGFGVDEYARELELRSVDLMFRYRVMDEDARLRLYALNQPEHPRFIRVSDNWDDS